MDAGWFSIADDYTILVREDLPDHHDYQFIAEYKGEKIRLPLVAEAAPEAMYLQEHRKLAGFDQGVLLGVDCKAEPSNDLRPLLEIVPCAHQLHVVLSD